MRGRELVLGLLASVLVVGCGGGKPGGKKTGGTVGTEETGGMGGIDSSPPDAGPPPLRPRGGGCTTAPQCQTGSCVAGFSCDPPCTGACTTCKLPGSEGRCLPVPEGMDPD